MDLLKIIIFIRILCEFEMPSLSAPHVYKQVVHNVLSREAACRA